MNDYVIAYEADLRCYPNYSFEIGDVDGDGRLEMVSLNQNGDRLRVANIDGRVLFERRLTNYGNWGTPLPALWDFDGDGRDEIVVPDLGRENRHKEARIVMLNGDGDEIADHWFGISGRDDYGIAVPLLAPFRHAPEGAPGVVAALAGGIVVGLDSDLNELWRVDGLFNDFAHEFYVADVDGDGCDEIAFCTLDHVDGGDAEWNRGELVLLDHDGSVMFRRSTRDYFPDSHFDDVAFADFLGDGSAQMLVEKGALIGIDGSVIWRLDEGTLDHGQWIAHVPEPSPDPSGAGRRILISELWGTRGRSAILTGDGRLVKHLDDVPWTRLDASEHPDWSLLPTRTHAVRWSPDSAPEFFVAEQTCSPTSHDAFVTREFTLRAHFLDVDGNHIASMPFEDAQIEGYWYNGEVRSRVADIDGDGCEEIVFPRQSGRVMILKKRGV